MYTFTRRLLLDALRVREALKLEPGIRPSFERAGIRTIITIIFCAMWNGAGDAAAIYRYLNNRDCQFGRSTIDFLLTAYEGQNADYHLWQRDALGNYRPLLAALPGGLELGPHLCIADIMSE